MNLQRLPWKTVLLTWLAFAGIAIINGTVRNLGYKPYVGDLRAHQISTLIILIIYIPAITYIFRNKIKELSGKQTLVIGGVWVLMTELFEFGAGHYLFGNSWQAIWHDYNIFEGRIWVLVLLAQMLTLWIRKNTEAKI